MKPKNVPNSGGSCGIWSLAIFGGEQGMFREVGDGDEEKSSVKPGCVKTENGYEGGGPPTIDRPSATCRLSCK